MTKYFRVDVDESEAFDASGALKDGHGISVPLSMTDAAPRSVATGGLHRPGYRFAADSAAADACDAANAEYLREVTNSWRIGDSRRKVQGRDPEGRETGTWEEEEEEERGRRRRRDSMTLDQLRHDHQQCMAREYQAYNNWIEDQWRDR